MDSYCLIDSSKTLTTSLSNFDKSNSFTIPILVPFIESLIVEVKSGIFSSNEVVSFGSCEHM